MTEEQAMCRALELARMGWGRVAPNPHVGAVLLRDGDLVGEGAHEEFGGRHAEINALASCDDPVGATCVVNLEPCNHHGKTPPCVEALIEAGVARVVYATADPHGAAAGGDATLRAAGVTVRRGDCEREAAALNAPFLWGVRRPDRPFVALKLAVSLDGFVADEHGRSQWISGPEAREWVHTLRAGFGAVGVGRRTAVADDPALTVRGAVTPRHPPVRVVFARSGAIPADLTLVTTARDTRTIVLSSPSAPRTELRDAGVTIAEAGSLRDALTALRDHGILSVLVEGGGTLAGALLDADLVDRLYCLQAPKLLGRGTPAMLSTRARSIHDAPSWIVTQRLALGQDTLLAVDRELCLQES